MRRQQNLLLQTWETRGQAERRTSQPSDAAGRANGWRKVQRHPTDTQWGSESETAALLSHAGSAHGSTQAGELRVAWYSLFRGSDMLLVPLALLSVETHASACLVSPRAATPSDRHSVGLRE